MVTLRSMVSTTSLGLILFVVPSAAYGIGLGPFFEYAHGLGETERRDFFGGVVDRDFDANRYSVGFALDTAVARDTLFNYRLNVGYSYRDQDYDGFGGSFDFHGLTLNNMFGFGVYRDSRARVWVGPSVRLNVDVRSDDSDFVDVGIGGGFALGANVHTGPNGSAAFTFGYQYLYVASFQDDSIFDDTLDGRQHLLSFNLTYFFRLSGDYYR